MFHLCCTYYSKSPIINICTCGFNCVSRSLERQMTNECLWNSPSQTYRGLIFALSFWVLFNAYQDINTPLYFLLLVQHYHFLLAVCPWQKFHPPWNDVLTFWTYPYLIFKKVDHKSMPTYKCTNLEQNPSFKLGKKELQKVRRAQYCLSKKRDLTSILHNRFKAFNAVMIT